LEPEIDTGGPKGRMVVTVLGMVAEMELGFIRDRQRGHRRRNRPPGISHGPFRSTNGCLLFEMHYHDPERVASAARV
jgi:DNA invertase Pin-like site-specific DNA recombinase